MEVEMWESVSGACPVGDFIDSLPKPVKARLLREIDHLEQQGLELMKTPKLKKLQGYDLHELKFRCQNIGVRILFQVKSNKAILLEGFIKKSEHTPARYIKNALSRSQSRQEYNR